MKNKNILLFDKKELFSLDKNFTIKEINSDIIESEIEQIISNLWNNTCSIEKELRPLFSSFLQINLMRKLYIYYFSLFNLKKKHSEIKVSNSNILVDIIGRHLKFTFTKNLIDHDNDFNLKRYYSFYDEKLSIKKKIKNLINYLNSFIDFKKYDILFSDQNRLRNELKKVKKSKIISKISSKKKIELNIDIELIKKEMKNNLSMINTSIPKNLIEELLEKRIFVYLPQTLKRISEISYYIKKKNIKLVIASSSVHEEDIVLLVSAKICKIETLLINHGLAGCKNQFLNNYIDYQVTFSPQEYQYKGAKCFGLSPNWPKL